jgi:hypothetical protein
MARDGGPAIAGVVRLVVVDLNRPSILKFVYPKRSA